MNTHLWPQLFAAGQHARLCQEMIHVIDTIGRSACFAQDANTPREVDQLLKQFFSCVTHSGFVIPDDQSEKFININPSLAALAAISTFKTTDACLETLKQQPNNFLKILALYSAHNSVKFDRAAIFQVNPRLASIWYMRFAEAFHGSLASPLVAENLREHFRFIPQNLIAVMGVQEPFFGVTYADPEAEWALKHRVNQAVQERWAGFPQPVFKPEPNHIAVVTANWSPGHSVYRIVQGLLAALKPKYHMTLFRLSDKADQDTSLFDECHMITTKDAVPDPTPLAAGKYQAILYPDVGMSDRNIHLANLRLAPVQMAFTGHSVSTMGAQMDYYISGAAVETPDRPERFYSERLVLLPGMGCVHKKPEIGEIPPGSRHAEPVVVNCPWSGPKINHRLVETLGAIAQRSRRPVIFRIFACGSLSTFKEKSPFERDLRQAMPHGRVEIIYSLPYPQYMAALCQGHFTLDSFHFSGCNTVSDALYLRMPIICREGERWYNRVGPQMLRLAGVPDLIAATDEQYISLALKLIHDDPWRDALWLRLMNADLDATVYGNSDAAHFARIFDDILQNHERYKQSGSRQPIRVT